MRCRPPLSRYPIRMRQANLTQHRLRAGMAGLGMIFDDTYRPLFEQLHAEGLHRRDFGWVEVELAAVASRTGARAARYKTDSLGKVADIVNCFGPRGVDPFLAAEMDVGSV